MKETGLIKSSLENTELLESQSCQFSESTEGLIPGLCSELLPGVWKGSDHVAGDRILVEADGGWQVFSTYPKMGSCYVIFSLSHSLPSSTGSTLVTVLVWNTGKGRMQTASRRKDLSCLICIHGCVC